MIDDEHDDYVPFFLTRGRWLRHIGLGNGTALRFTRTGEQLTTPVPKELTP